MLMRRVAVLLSTIALVVTGAGPATPQETEPAIVYSAIRYGGSRVASTIFTIVPGEQRIQLTGDRSFNLDPVWSPDRSRIAYVHHARPRNPDVWLMDADGSDKVRLTRGPEDDVYPQWSPDGTHIAWVKETPYGGRSRIHVMHPDGADKMAVSPKRHRAGTPAWAPDGHFVAYAGRPRCSECSTDAEVYVVDGHSSGATPHRLTDNDVHDVTPAWSPDGERIAFVRERADGADVFTIASDGSDEQQLTDLDGYAFAPRWSPDGTEIAFTLVVDVDDFHTRVAVVDVATGEERLLTDVATGGVTPHWSPDGSHLAFLGFHSGGYNLGTIRPDGTDATQLTRSRLDEAGLDW